MTAAMGAAALAAAQPLPAPPPPPEAPPPPPPEDGDAGAPVDPLDPSQPPTVAPAPVGPPVAPPPAPPAPPPPPQQPPPQPYGGRPAYGGWGPPVMPPMDQEPPKPPPGQTEAGVPFAQRGSVAFDFGATNNTEGRNVTAGMSLVGTFPVADRTFVDAVVPFGLILPLGNPTLGAHHVGKLGKRLWITGGGAIGIPVLAEGFDDGIVQAAPKAFWDTHHYMPDTLPLQVALGLEYHVSIVELRLQLEPSLWVPLGDRNDDVDGSFQHAGEIQLGHDIGGGLRIQGIAIGRGDDFQDDHYQFALSPFFVIHREMGFLRLGLMLPMDEQLGPPFEESFGFLATTGIHID